MHSFDLILIPDNEEEGSIEICVEVSIQNRKYVFLLDTGAGLTSVPSDDLTESYQSHGIHKSSGLLGDSRNEIITIHDFQLGSIKRSSLPVSRMSAGSARRGLIGMDLLKDYCCRFLFSENRVEFGSVISRPLDYLFLDARDHPYVPVVCDGEEIPATWDTGASLSCVDIHFIQCHPDMFDQIGESAGTDSSGGTIVTPLFKMKDFACGGHLFSPHTVVGIDLEFVNSRIDNPMMMILGYNTLYQADWIFDFPRKKWGILNINHPSIDP